MSGKQPHASSLPLLDYIMSAKARDEGMQRVADNNTEWIALALFELDQLSRGKHEWSNLDYGFIGEDLREMLAPKIGKPSTPHCYGALVRMALKRGLLEETGTLRPMKNIGSHARRSMVYRWKARAP